jgi:hypothetical protein
MNRQVPGNLDQIIAALETQADRKGTGRRMRADNTAHLIAAAIRRHELARSKAIRAVRELDAAGTTALRRAGQDIDAVLARICPARHENVHFYGAHSVDVVGELAKLDSGGYRPPARHRHRAGLMRTAEEIPAADGPPAAGRPIRR